MKVKHEPNYVSDKVECFKINYCTLVDYKQIKSTFKLLDVWIDKTTKWDLDSLNELDEFGLYLVMDRQNSMLFKLAYISDK